MSDKNILEFPHYDCICELVINVIVRCNSDYDCNSLSFHLVRPVLSFSVTPSTVNETQNATADCKVVEANPTPNITIRSNSNHIIPHIGGQAKLESITRAQAGEYTCMANNRVGGAATSTAILNVNCEYKRNFYVS